MTAKNSFELRMIATAVVLGLLMNPLFYSSAQEPESPLRASSSQDAQVPVPPMPDEDNAPTQPTAAPPRTVAPIPPETLAPAKDELPDSPGALAQSTQISPQPVLPSPQPRNEAVSNPQEPLGTAAAQTVPTMGIAASRPAGAALAPGKQRRVRTILIRVGAIVGVGAAVGATMALSEGSPSKPPGAH